MRVRRYGSSGPVVIALHGGPGAPGYLGPVAEQLAASFRVLEPFQRPSGGQALTVARHVADLHELVGGLAPERPALLGHSWGAMLALAYAAAHPGDVGAVVLVASGTFDRASRAELERRLAARMDDALRARFEALRASKRHGAGEDDDERLRVVGDLLLEPYSCELVEGAHALAAPEQSDARASRETWDDMIACQERGLYPASFAAIDVPVLSIHGADDPHPGEAIHASLSAVLPHLEHHLWERCGHYPWLERAAADRFFDVVTSWLALRLARRSDSAAAPGPRTP